MEIISLDKIREYIKSGLIKENIHPDNENIRIYNYTHECQFDRKWDEVTTTCRGLIMNILTGKIIARPFPKFFNLQEHLDVFKKELPTEEPIITEKVDGSLGILYWLKTKKLCLRCGSLESENCINNEEHEFSMLPWIATRGSFTSDQAIWATGWFRRNVDYSNLPKDITLLFEIIYKENRIVKSNTVVCNVFLASFKIRQKFQ